MCYCYYTYKICIFYRKLQFVQRTKFTFLLDRIDGIQTIILKKVLEQLQEFNLFKNFNFSKMNFSKNRLCSKECKTSDRYINFTQANEKFGKHILKRIAHVWKSTYTQKDKNPSKFSLFKQTQNTFFLKNCRSFKVCENLEGQNSFQIQFI